MTYYIKLLKEELDKKKIKNPAYTLRTYARYLDMDSGSLSGILNERRPFPLSKVDLVSDKLQLSQEEKNKFITSIIQQKKNLTSKSSSPELKQFVLDENESYEYIADWEFSAIPSLCKIKDQVWNPETIANRLNISLERSLYVTAKLEEAELIKNYINNEDEVLVRFTTSEDIESKALQKSHTDGLNMGKEKIKNIETQLRDFSSLTLPVNTSKLPKAKKLIRKFRKDLNLLLEDGEEDEVYYLGVQLFPLSQK